MTHSDIGVVRDVHPRHPRAAVIRFTREQVRNALGPQQLLQAARHLEDCQHDPGVGVVFLTGTGSAFTSGFDLKQLNELPPEQRPAALDTATELMTRIVTMPKVVIAAVNGNSSGLGNHIAICSDLCVVRRGAAFHFTGSAKGIPSMQYGALLLPMVIGLKRAKSLLLRGGRLDADEAERLGLCNEVVDEAGWDAHIDALAEEFSGKHAATIAQNKYQLNQLAFQLLGALKLSSLAGASQMAAAESFATGAVPQLRSAQ
jgi:enoyl-CoA hydratase/carnithine racemase